MSRKHYIQLAELVHDYRDELPAEFVADLASYLKSDNPRFNAGRFFDAACFPELTGTRQGLN